MQSKESALDLVSLLNDDEKRAFRLFQIDNLEVGRYYEQALRQRRLIFYVGILCIIVGFASVFAAFRLVASGSQEQLSEKIVVASLGTIGGILANFVGLIFLRMFSSVVQSMVDFHKRLVATHHVVFGNLLVAKIQDAEMRNSTLSKIAQALSRVATNDDSDKSNEPPSAPL
jgi:cytochrome c biogenesis protein CcdA